MAIILPTSYLPRASYVAQILSGAEVIIDLGEHYIKRSQRNRAHIMTAQGEMALSIPLRHANRPRQAVSTLEIDYSQRWQHQHWLSITSAYRAAPYFEHFAVELEQFYKKEWLNLADYNKDFLETILRMLELRGSAITRPHYSTDYVTAAEGDVDLRPKTAQIEGFTAPEYFQVFSDRVPFVGDLSVLDLLLCEGLNARKLLEASYRPL